MWWFICSVRQRSLEFLEAHFTGIFSQVHFGNHYLSEEERTRLKPRSKSAICLDLGAVAIVDDSLAIALECSEIGMNVK